MQSQLIRIMGLNSPFFLCANYVMVAMSNWEGPTNNTFKMTAVPDTPSQINLKCSTSPIHKKGTYCYG